LKFKSKDIVYWKSPSHSSGYVQDILGNPTEFIVLAPRRKYCLLRSLKFYKGGFSYQDLRDFDMSQLEFVRHLEENAE